jgi:hypothetical protein
VQYTLHLSTHPIPLFSSEKGTKRKKEAKVLLHINLVKSPNRAHGSAREPAAMQPATLKSCIVKYFTPLNLLTPGSRALLEKVVIAQLVKNFHDVYGIRKFITIFTKASHWTLS